MEFFQKKLFYSKSISDQNYNISKCQKIHFQNKIMNYEIAIFTRFYLNIFNNLLL